MSPSTCTIDLYNRPASQSTCFTIDLLHNRPASQSTCFTIDLLHNRPASQSTCFTIDLHHRPSQSTFTIDLHNRPASQSTCFTIQNPSGKVSLEHVTIFHRVLTRRSTKFAPVLFLQMKMVHKFCTVSTI